MAWAAAMPWIISGGAALLGGLAGRKSAKDSGKPTITRNTVGAPPDALGGYGRISAALDRARDSPLYRPGADNPYLSSGMAHIFGRAGITPPAGGYSNPYLQRQQQMSQPAQSKNWWENVPPEVMAYLQNQLKDYKGPNFAGANIPQGGGP